MQSRFNLFLKDLLGALALAIILVAGTTQTHAAELTVLPKMIGCTADGKYRVFDLHGQPGDVLYQAQIRGQWYQWTDVDLYNNLPHVRAEDIDGRTYRCDNAVCFTADGWVIGAAPWTVQ
jgi:hypothetical protein